jgi:methylenetetrahydrofolate reductase (NADPH)
LEGAPRFFIGAAVNPFADPFEIRVPRLKLKMAAGVDFVQTQCIYNMAKFKAYMEEAWREGLPERVSILAGVTPLKSVGMAKFMRRMVAGMDIPDTVVERIGAEPKEKQAAKGIEMCIEQIQELKEIKGIAGVHVMAIEWEEKLAEIIGGAGLLPRPLVD